MGEAILEVRGLEKRFPVRKGFLWSHTTGWLRAVDGVDFVIGEGETFSLIGESGCGKTTTARLILLLQRPSAGSVLFRGRDVCTATVKELTEYRRSVQAVFQEPHSSLDPRMRIRDIVSEPLCGDSYRSKARMNERVAEVLNEVGLSASFAGLFPHEFSGGQRQRIAVARALASSPKCIILDEPVSALDVSIRAQIMNLLKRLQARFGHSYLLIAHDLAVVRYLSTRVAVMYLGKLVEVGPCSSLYAQPLHPYTQALLSSALPLHPDDRRKRIVLEGEVPSPLNPPPGCRFHPRCFAALPMCSEVEPQLKEVEDDHLAACHLC